MLSFISHRTPKLLTQQVRYTTTVTKTSALEYHSQSPHGKLGTVLTKPLTTQLDLSLAYTPGVAFPCLEIAKNKSNSYLYTSKGNLVAVISNGTAVLGLGNLGPEASKPVMEGKSVLMKRFGGLDSYDIEIDATEVDEVVRVVKAIAPTFGGINLEDFKAPECFEIEERLKKLLDIPVMHDDQHGTAIIVAAALKNALFLAKKDIRKVNVVIAGAGAAAIACAKLIEAGGVQRENIIMTDTQGVIRKDRTNLSKMKQQYATHRTIDTLPEALKGADVFIGVAVADILKPEDVLSMADSPIVFALSNPNPEIDYHLAMSIRKDIIMATGRSDHPNQINNVLGFPYIFRGALDVWAKSINEQMKLAAVDALVDLTRKPVPELVKNIYEEPALEFGPLYIIPKVVDPRLIEEVSSAVAKAAMDSGVARLPIEDWDAYKASLRKLLPPL